MSNMKNTCSDLTQSFFERERERQREGSKLDII